MEQQRFSRSFICLTILFGLALRVTGNFEGEALAAMRKSLSDPGNVIQSWNGDINPCVSFDHVFCNSENRVSRVDLGNANLSGQLVPQLGQLPHLQYLELYDNNITGGIPEELGDLTELLSLDLSMNNLSGPIPSSLGKLKKLRLLRLHNNALSGEIPMSLTAVSSLQVLDVSNNRLSGYIPVNGSFSPFTPISFANNNLRRLPSVPASSSSGRRMTVAIAIRVVAGAAVLFAGQATALAW